MNRRLQILDGVLVGWGLSPAEVIARAPEGMTFPAEMEVFQQLDLSDLGIFTYAASERPVYNDTTHRCVEAPPVEIAGVWTQQWSIVPLPEEQLQEFRVAKQREAIPLFAFRRALIDQQTVVESAFTALDPAQRRRMKLRWEMQPFVSRNSILAAFVIATLKLTEAQVDAIFGTSEEE